MTVDSLDQQSASTALAKLDFESGSSGQAGLCLKHDSFQGPFGVLNLLPTEASPDNQPESQADRAEPTQLEMDLFWQSRDAASTIAGDSHLFAGLYDLAEDPENAPTSDPLLGVGTIPDDLQIFLPESANVNSNEIIFQPTSMSLNPVPDLALLGSKRIPPLAPDLLRYFKEKVISLSFPLKNCQECPWQAVHLPSAMSTFAELSVHQTTSHTRLSLFYSLLAASCLHMYAQDQFAEDLNISAKRFKETAKQHLGLALNVEVLGPKPAKYKEILMAVLSMVMLSVCFPIVRLPATPCH